MEPKLISVYFGGERKKNDEDLTYIGDTELKPFVVADDNKRFERKSMSKSGKFVADIGNEILQSVQLRL